MRKRSLLAASLVLCLLLTGCRAYRHRVGNDAGTVVAELPVKTHRVTGCSAENYTMDMTLDTQQNVVYGTSTVEVTNKTNAALGELCFRLYSANISSGQINSAANAETGNEYKVETKRDPSVIYVSLKDDAILPGETLPVVLDFKSEIPVMDDRLGCHIDDKGNLYNMSFCFPQLAFFEDGAWHEAKYNENGESYCYEMTNYHVTMTAPADYVVLSSGKAETVDGKTVIEAPNVREMAITACNFAEIITKESNGVTYHVLAPDYFGYEEQYLADLYDTLLTVAIESVEMYSEKIGDYIYDELDVIPMQFDSFGGMEFPGLIQVMMPMVGFDDLESKLCSFTAVATAHEVGHQWFYGAVSNNTNEEPWMDEAFTSYLEYLYWDEFEEGKEAVEAFNDQYAPGAEYIENVTRFADAQGRNNENYVNLPMKEYDGVSYGEIVYAEGAWFLRELELTMGADRFFEMMSDWYNENLHQVVTGRAFITHVLEYDSSQLVKDVINEYISEKYL